MFFHCSSVLLLTVVELVSYKRSVSEMESIDLRKESRMTSAESISPSLLNCLTCWIGLLRSFFVRDLVMICKIFSEIVFQDLDLIWMRVVWWQLYFPFTNLIHFAIPITDLIVFLFPNQMSPTFVTFFINNMSCSCQLSSRDILFESTGQIVNIKIFHQNHPSVYR